MNGFEKYTDYKTVLSVNAFIFGFFDHDGNGRLIEKKIQII